MVEVESTPPCSLLPDLGQLRNTSVPHFPHQQNVGNTGPDPRGPQWEQGPLRGRVTQDLAQAWRWGGGGGALLS